MQNINSIWPRKYCVLLSINRIHQHEYCVVISITSIDQRKYYTAYSLLQSVSTLRKYGVYCCSDSGSRAQWPQCRDLEPFTLDPTVHCMDPSWITINYRITHRATTSVLTNITKRRKTERKETTEKEKESKPISGRHAIGKAYQRVNQKKPKRKYLIQKGGEILKIK